MGTLLASQIIARASEIAQDEANVTWSTTQALAWVNEAQRTIAGLRPDAATQIAIKYLAPGTKQNCDGRRLMACIRNMGGGSTPGRAIRLVEKGVKDDFNPNWHSDLAASEIEEYMYDVRVPKQFYVYPPVTPVGIVAIELEEAITPPDLASVSTAISIDDIYQPSLVEWVCYRFFARDAEEVANAQRAAGHFSAFFAVMGEKMQKDLAINPKIRAHLDE